MENPQEIRDLIYKNASLEATVIGQQKEINALLNHLADMRVLINRFTETNMKIEYKPIVIPAPANTTEIKIVDTRKRKTAQ